MALIKDWHGSHLRGPGLVPDDGEDDLLLQVGGAGPRPQPAQVPVRPQRLGGERGVAPGSGQQRGVGLGPGQGAVWRPR